MPRLPMTEFKILQFLKHKEKMYAFEIVKHSGGAIKLGTVYTTLQRMADKELVVSSQDCDSKIQAQDTCYYWICRQNFYKRCHIFRILKTSPYEKK
jgi:Fe2+ or Zn2+ uptake regulation protein